MKKRVKLALLALLGFSAACSTVKNVPARGGEPKDPGTDTTAVGDTPRVMLMYGVRTPVPVRVEEKRQDSGLDPVVEVPGPDTLQTVAPEPATVSGLDPVVERPEE